MKRTVCILFALIFILGIIPVQSYAVEQEQRQVLEDGSYYIDTLSVSSARAASTKVGTKTRTYYSNSGTAEWQIVLTASFSFDGSSAICDTAICTSTIWNSDWHTASKSATKSGNTAVGYATMKLSILGVTFNEVPVTLTLSCDASGNLS